MRAVSLIPVKAALVVMAATIPLAACSSGSGTSGPATASASGPATASTSGPASSPAAPATATQSGSALCANIAAVRTAVTQLTHVKLSKDTVTTMAAAAGNVVTALNNLSRQSNGQFSAQIGDLRSAVDTLQASVKALAAGHGSVTEAVSALRAVTEKSESLVTAASGSCPSPTPSG
ncbi:MAG: hypothetical protein JO037_25195 [Actinobacteria bacterium]|nr:hypothetical protein [Actinomycetota bacterium]